MPLRYLPFLGGVASPAHLGVGTDSVGEISVLPPLSQDDDFSQQNRSLASFFLFFFFLPPPPPRERNEAGRMGDFLGFFYLFFSLSWLVGDDGRNEVLFLFFFFACPLKQAQPNVGHSWLSKVARPPPFPPSLFFFFWVRT